ncbi:MAG TPA: NUDIX hydrolase [Nitrospiria bacterium]|nr:NUDIX hydrolase [Nitrospiria bacterium]
MKKSRESKRVYDGKLLKIELDRVTLPNGNVADLEMIHHPGASAVVPLLEDGNILLVHQYRYAAGGFIFEIPAGKLDSGEDPLACAGRELEEETGYRAGRYTKLLSFLTTPGFCDEVIHIYIAEDLVPGKQDLEENEVLEIRKIPFTKTMEMIASGEIRDGKTIIGLQAAWLKLKSEGKI